MSVDESRLGVTVVLEERFDRTPNGKVWTRSPSSYSFWVRYLEVFGWVRVVARTRDVAEVASDWREVTGPSVTCFAIPYYLGPREYARRWLSVQRALWRALPDPSAVILRLSSVLGSPVARRLRRAGWPYGVEVVADPYDVFAPGAVVHPLRALFRWRLTKTLRRECSGAAAVSYVTQHELQRRYPAGAGALSVACSDVELPEAAFALGPREAASGPLVLIGVGSLQQRYKGFDLLIESLAVCRRAELDLRLVILGDGRHRGELEDQACALGLAERVEFTGWLASKEEVRARLDSADVFVLSSRADGLPRALVEAMARALPCLGTRVGGVPELLVEEDLVPPGDVGALAAKLEAVFRSPTRRERMSARNWNKAKGEYAEDVLRSRRVEFYRTIRARTEDWLKR